MAAIADGGKSKGAPARKSSRVAAKEGSKPREAKSSKPKEIKEKVNKTRVVSDKKKAPSRPEPTHPSYFEMVVEAIATLKERSGSSRIAITKYIEEHYKSELPANFKKFLNNQLRNLSEKGQITQVKGSFKLADELKKSSVVKAINKVADKQPSAEAKPERAAVKAAGAPKHPKKLKVAKISQASKAVKSSKVAKPAPKSPKPAEPAAVKVADHEKPTPKAKPAVKAGRGRPAAGSKSASYPAPPTPKPEKTAAVAKKGKPAPSKSAPASKSKSTPAKGSSTPANRKSPRVPPASSKTAASPPPAKRTRK